MSDELIRDPAWADNLCSYCGETGAHKRDCHRAAPLLLAAARAERDRLQGALEGLAKEYVDSKGWRRCIRCKANRAPTPARLKVHDALKWVDDRAEKPREEVAADLLDFVNGRAPAPPACAECQHVHLGGPHCARLDDAGVFCYCAAPTPLDTAGQPDLGVFITGQHPTCTACDSLILASGGCVNGCEKPNDSTVRAEGGRSGGLATGTQFDSCGYPKKETP